MKRHFSLAALSCVILACATTCVFAEDPPTSAEQLRRQLESALRARDTNTVRSLYCLDGLVDMYGRRELSVEEKNSAFVRSLWPSFATNVTKVKLLPLTADFQAASFRHDETGIGRDWGGDSGWRVKWSIPIVGMLDVDPPRTGKEPLIYGKTNGFFYLAIPIFYQAPGKSLYVQVLHLPDSTTYTGSWVFVKNGKEITLNTSDTTNQFRNCWGDYIKSCTIRRTSTNEAHWFHFEISEDGTNIFESGEITNQEPVTYERKM